MGCCGISYLNSGIPCSLHLCPGISGINLLVSAFGIGDLLIQFSEVDINGIFVEELQRKRSLGNLDLSGDCIALKEAAGEQLLEVLTGDTVRLIGVQVTAQSTASAGQIRTADHISNTLTDLIKERLQGDNIVLNHIIQAQAGDHSGKVIVHSKVLQSGDDLSGCQRVKGKAQSTDLSGLVVLADS